jgi:hypothetical protein
MPEGAAALRETWIAADFDVDMVFLPVVSHRRVRRATDQCVVVPALKPMRSSMSLISGLDMKSRQIKPVR